LTPPTPLERQEKHHMQRLQTAWNVQHGPRQTWPTQRGTKSQQPQRELEHLIRKSVLAFRRWTAKQGLSRTQASTRLRLASRTLADWEQAWRQDRLQPQPRGRPQQRADVTVRNEVIGTLRTLPAIGLPTLESLYPELARGELRDLLRRYRRVYRKQNQLLVHVLHWQRPGAVWAVDYTAPPQPIEGHYAAVLAVRDLASNRQLAWLPVESADASAAADALTALFREHGAPLVLKADNGSPFTSEEVRGLLDYENVLPLFSPPRLPRYNGAIEAGIGSLKTRTHHEAARHARPGAWTCDDCEAARLQANETARPWGAGGATPDQVWDQRRHMTLEEREAFCELVRSREREAREERNLAPEATLDRPTQAAIDRCAIRRALGALGFLSWSRRRITLVIRRLKVAKIS
jgi:putative transposase